MSVEKQRSEKAGQAVEWSTQSGGYYKTRPGEFIQFLAKDVA